MENHYIDAPLMRKMFLAGASYLARDKEMINDLNVFPVPDGDTGTNMTLTIMSAVNEVKALEKVDVDSMCKAISSGSLRGARGNSGVILSQLLRGFTKTVKDKDKLDAKIIAEALAKATETAYKAVIKPKEGTILTVAKSISDKAVEVAHTSEDLTDFFDIIITCGEQSLAYTPELLPVLKEAGVVDSGGKGLLTILHGMVDAYNGIEVEEYAEGDGESKSEPKRVREHIETDDIKFGYCTEFIVVLNKEFTDEDERSMKEFLMGIGDSLVLVADEEIVKIHVHTNDPGIALQKGIEYGELTRLKIDNMREEHRETLFKMNSANEPAKEEKAEEKNEEWIDTAFLAVCAGEGLSEIFTQLGTNKVISGGQSMNPSTEDIINAINEVHAHNVFVLPNNKNIILAAEQAAKLVDDCEVTVIPTTTIPQGISALVSYVPEDSKEDNVKAITSEIKKVSSGEITYAVRDTSIDGIEVHEGDIIGIGDSGLIYAGDDVVECIVSMCKKMSDEDSELVSIYFGSEADESLNDKISSRLEEELPDLDVDIQCGGQPVYYYILSVE